MGTRPHVAMELRSYGFAALLLNLREGLPTLRGNDLLRLVTLPVRSVVHRGAISSFVDMQRLANDLYKWAWV